MADDQKPETHIEEQEALELAREQGIEFVDTYIIEGELTKMGVPVEFSTLEEAEEVADGRPIIQSRVQKTPQEVSNE